jgi:hypothetical protein
MRSLVTAAIVVAIATLPCAARADGLIAKLPEDGIWAIYRAEGYKERGNKTREEITGSLRVSSVGKATESGEPCRWIELELSYKTDDGDKRWTEKLLIPEKYLTQGAAPAEHIVRGWLKFDSLPNEGQPRPADSLDGRPHSRGSAFYLRGPGVEERELVPVSVKCKLGEPLCAGRKGSYHLKLKNGERVGEVSGTFEVRLHDEAAFGIVSYQDVVRSPDGREAMMKFVLDDFGAGAKSRLPKQE